MSAAIAEGLDDLRLALHRVEMRLHRLRLRRDLA
jgi:hypothetical protein